MSARCPKPGCGAQKLIAKPCTDFDCPQDWTVKRLTAAGYRILAPGDLDPVTVERCAQEADEHSYARDIDWWLTATKKDVSADACRSVATAIRSLQENKNG